jgi:hypothetical protein
MINYIYKSKCDGVMQKYAFARLSVIAQKCAGDASGFFRSSQMASLFTLGAEFSGPSRLRRANESRGLRR